MQHSVEKVRVKRGTAQGHLLASAQQLFAERGYRGTTTKDIAHNASVSENLIFRYFKSKSELMLAAVVDPLLELLRNFRDDWQRHDGLRAESHEETVHRFVGEIVDLIDSNHGLARAILNVLVERPAEFDTAALARRFADVLQGMVPEMGDFLSRGGLRSTNPGLALRMGVIAAITNVVLLPQSYGQGERPPSKSEIVDELTNFVVYGLQPVPARSSHRTSGQSRPGEGTPRR